MKITKYFNNSRKREQIERQLIEINNDVRTYRDGILLNLKVSNEGTWAEYKRRYPRHSLLVKKYVKIVEQDKSGNYIPLPPFIVFPHYALTTMGWRQGIGELYEDIWKSRIEQADKETVTLFCGRFDYPTNWLDEIKAYEKIDSECPGRYLGYPWKNMIDSKTTGDL